jgi:MerR family mercuric resistance operon transcriptional regulator
MRVSFIRRAQELGFTLREINEMLDLRLDSATTCSEVEDKVAEKVNEIETKIDDLGEIRDALERLAERCRTSPPTSHCPFLEELAEQR